VNGIFDIQTIINAILNCEGENFEDEMILGIYEAFNSPEQLSQFYNAFEVIKETELTKEALHQISEIIKIALTSIVNENLDSDIIIVLEIIRVS
jgi:tRNA uridine 5-carbamoylmethylation protein Kti12